MKQESGQVLIAAAIIIAIIVIGMLIVGNGVDAFTHTVNNCVTVVYQSGARELVCQ